MFSRRQGGSFFSPSWLEIEGGGKKKLLLMQSEMWLLLLLCLLLLLPLGFRRLKRAMMFHPSVADQLLPPAEGREVWVDRRLHGWWFRGRQGKKISVLLFLGNAGNKQVALPLIQGFRALGFGLLVCDYSGFGPSKGQPSERQLQQDALA